MALINVANNTIPQTPASGTSTVYVDNASKTLAMMNDSGIPTYYSGLGFKNKLVNGNFQFWQVGTSSTASGYLADQWYCGVNGSVTYSQIAINAGGCVYGLTATTSASSSYPQVQQPLEQAEVIPLRGKTVTFSIYLQANSTFVGNYNASTDALASQTTSAANVIITPTTTLTRYSVSFVVPTTAVGLMVYAQPVSMQSSGAVVTHAMAQLEIGSAATQFETLPYALELHRCQRFLYVLSNASATQQFAAIGQCQTTTSAVFLIGFPVQMRAVPAFSVSSVSHWSINQAAGTGVAITGLVSAGTTLSGIQSFMIAATGASGLVAGNATHLVPYAAYAARLYFNAQL